MYLNVRYEQNVTNKLFVVTFFKRSSETLFSSTVLKFLELENTEDGAKCNLQKFEADLTLKANHFTAFRKENSLLPCQLSGYV